MQTNTHVCLSNEFGKVHITENSHHSRILAVIRTGTLCCPKCSQHRQNVPQPKVIMNLQNNCIFRYGASKYRTTPIQRHLFRQLLFTELVQSKELLGENNVLLEATAGQFDTHDDLRDTQVQTQSSVRSMIAMLYARNYRPVCLEPS